MQHKSPPPRERGADCELASHRVVGPPTEAIAGQSQIDGVTARCIEVRVGGARPILRGESTCAAPPRKDPLIDTPCSAVVPCPEEVKISCDSAGSAFTPCAPSSGSA